MPSLNTIWAPTGGFTTSYQERVDTYTTQNTVKKDASSGSTHSATEFQDTKSSTFVLQTITDNGAGGFVGGLGTVSYAAKTLSLKVVSDWMTTSYKSDHENANDWAAANDSTSTGYNAGQPASGSTGGSATAKGGTWGSSDNKEVFSAAALIVKYAVGTASAQAGTTTFLPPGIAIDLAPYTSDRIVPGSVRFTWMGVAYEDFEGVIYRGRTASTPGIASGAIAYNTGVATMSDYVVGAGGFTLDSLWTCKGDWHTASVYFRTPVAPIKPTGLVFSVIDVGGEQIVATADFDGTITGPHCLGKIDYETGVVEVLFGDYVTDATLTTEQKAEWWYNAALVGTTGKIWRPWPVDPTSLRYNAVSYFYLPLDADILGLDPVRLPQDGRVPIFRPGGFAVLGNAQTVSVTAANGMTVNCARSRLSRVRITGANGSVITAGYSVDLDAGTVTFIDVTGYSQPVTIEHRIEDLVQVADVQITGQVGFTRSVTHDYPALSSYLSSALVIGDMRARVPVLFDQTTWDTTFKDGVVGSVATATYNDVLAPIVVTNAGALTERWAIRFTNTTTFDVIGEHVGQIATGNTTSDLAPINPASGAPYFSLKAIGWGSGWAAGNVLRFNTIGALFPIWIARTIQQGAATAQDDSFTVLVRGDIDRP